MRRRKFLKQSALATSATLLLPSLACSKKSAKTGLALYTVRSEMISNPEGSLDTISSIGYNWLEAADYRDGLFYGVKPLEFRKMIESRGMSLISSHADWDDANMLSVIRFSADAGIKYLVMPSLPSGTLESVDNIKRMADYLNSSGKAAKGLGVKIGFHNHQAEFKPVDGLFPYDILLENTDPGLVCFEMDLAWISAAGKSPLEYFKRYPGRFELLHVKDLTPDKKDATLGEGTLDFVPVFEKSKEAGMKYFFVEQDDCLTHTPFESVEVSRNFLLDKIL